MARAPAATLREHERALADVAADPPPVVAIFGDEPFLRRVALDAVLDAVERRHPGVERVVIRAGPADAGPPPDFAALERELAGASLFAARKVVALRDADRLLFPAAGARDDDDDGDGDGDAAPFAPAGSDPPKAGQDRFARLVADPPPDRWLVTESAALPKNRVAGKALWAHAKTVPCPVVAREGELADWLRRRAHAAGRSLTPGAAQWLVAAHGGNLGVLASEIDKLALYLAGGDGGPDAAIDEDIVALFFNGTEEYHAFALSNALEARDAGEAMRVLRLVTEQGGRDRKGKRLDANAASRAMLARLPATVLGLLAGAMARETGGGADDVAAWTKSAPWRAERLLRAAARYRLPDLRRAASALAAETRVANDTGGDARLALERALAALVARH